MTPQEMRERLELLQLVVDGRASSFSSPPGIAWTKSQIEEAYGERQLARAEIRRLRDAMKPGVAG